MDKDKEIKRLNFEDILWIIFIITSLLNVKGNNYQKKYVITNDLFYENEANNIYVIVLFIVLFLYLYFFIRNYSMYQNKGINATKEDYIKVIGSIFFIIGTLCLIYFQINSEDNFIGGPAI